MNKPGTDAAPRSVEKDEWTLIRGARQLLTLRGAIGLRRGSAMSDLNVIQDGAVLVRNGVIEHVGTTRQVENLAPARHAREIDAAGKVVMPAFVDPDAALTSPPVKRAGGNSEERDIRRMSRRRLDSRAATIAADLARHGVLTVGANTLLAPDLRNTTRVLRLHQSLQSRPLRIRSVFAPPFGADDGEDYCRRVSQTWMPSVHRGKLASLMELPVTAGTVGDARELASAAAASEFTVRLRVSGPVTTEILELAHDAGAIAIIGPIHGNSAMTHVLADAGCIKVILTAQMLTGNSISERSAVDDGFPVALASGYRHDEAASLNPQFTLFLACGILGLTVEEAIVAATHNAACSLRISHVTASLAPGKSADICLMDVDDYHELARRAGHSDVALAMRAGKIVYRRPNLTLD